ncbi:MAG TPA: hypothetical protein PLH57_06050 [Oligoflexia bacterium]|nr:hypothetical protein [Oligoflexia bacterium]
MNLKLSALCLLSALLGNLALAQQATPVPSPSPAAQAEETKLTPEEELALQKEKFEFTEEEINDFIEQLLPTFNALKEDVLDPKVIKSALTIKNTRDRASAIYTGVLLTDLSEGEDGIPVKLTEAVLETAADLAKRSIKSPLGLGLLSCVATDEQGTSWLQCNIEDLRLFFTAVAAAKGKKSSEVLTTIFKSVYEQELDAEKKLRESIGIPVTDESEVKEENTKIFTCSMGEMLLDAPIFRKPCRRFKPYVEYLERLKKEEEELRAMEALIEEMEASENQSNSNSEKSETDSNSESDSDEETDANSEPEPSTEAAE